MNNGFNPLEEGFAPIPDTNEAAAEAAAGAPLTTEPTQIEKYQAAKKAFSKVGLAILILFLALQVVGSLVISFPAVIKGIEMGMSEEFQELIANIASGSEDDITQFFTGFVREIAQTVMVWSIIGTAVGMVVGILFERLILKKVPAAPIEKKKLSFGEYFFMLIVALGFWGAGAIVGNIPGLLGLKSPLDSMMSGDSVIFIIYAIIGAPILEELAFRKLILDKLAPYGEVPAAFLSALLFGLFHGNSTQFVLAFCVGMVFAVVYMRTGNILYTMSFHMIINTIGSLTSIADMAGASTELCEIIDWGTYGLLLVFAIAGIIIAVKKKDSPLLYLKKPNYLGCNSVIFSNVGFRIFMIVSIIEIVSIDAASLVMSLTSQNGLWSFAVLIPTAVFFVFLFGIKKKVGKHADIPEEMAESSENDGFIS